MPKRQAPEFSIFKCDAIWENSGTWCKFNIWSSQYHEKDFNLLFLKLVKFCLYDTYIQGKYHKS